MSPMSHFAERSRLPPGPVRSLILHPSLLISRPAVVRRRHRARHHSREESPQRVGATSPGRKTADDGCERAEADWNLYSHPDWLLCVPHWNPSSQ